MEIGLAQLREADKNTLLHLLALPFVDPAGSYDISHRAVADAAPRRDEEDS